MRFWQYTVALGLAGLVFAAALVSEYWQFEQYESIDQIEFSSGVIDVNTEHEDRLLTTGEFARIYDGAMFSVGDRELEDGVIFIGGTFFEPETIPRESWEERGMVFEGFNPTVNTLKAGPLLLHFPAANVLVERNNDWKQTDVWAFGHSIEIWFPGARYPFVLPSEMRVSIRESLVNDSTYKLYYSKLKKDFQLKRYELPDEVVRMRSMEQLMLQSLLAHQHLRDSFEPIAWDVIKTWRGGAEPVTAVAKFVRNWHKMSLKYAIGVPERKRDTFEFLVAVAPLVETWRTADSVTVDKVEQNVEWFREMIDTNVDWKRLLDRSTFWSLQWEQFSLAQKMWLPSRLPGTGEAAFSVLWEVAPDGAGIGNSRGIFELQRLFSATEILIANDFSAEAVRALKAFSRDLAITKTTKQDRFEITRFRRLLTALLKQHEEFHHPELFELLEELVELESELHVMDPDFADEIQLEAAQDLLFFIGMFLEKSVDVSIPQQLLSHWNNRRISNLSEKYGREIFSEDEREVLAYISLAGQSGVGAEEIRSIQESKDWRNEMEHLIQGLMIPEVEVEQQDLLPEEKARELAEWMESQLAGWEWVVLTQSSTKWTIEGRNIDQLARIEFAPRVGMGVVKIGTESEPDIPRMMLPRVLRNLQNKLKSDAADIVVDVGHVFPSQTTPKAVLERRYVQQLLRSTGFEVERSAVLMMDEDGAIFKIEDAGYEGYHFAFEFKKGESVIQNMTYRQGGDAESFEGSWPLPIFIPWIDEHFGLE